MNPVVWLAVGGGARRITRSDAQQGLFLHAVGGVIGAALAVWLLSPQVGIGEPSLGALLVSLAGAVIVPTLVNLFRRGTPR
ncbi:GlsB/YeaQ/YmgE family stress response membrane protein [Rubrivivax sp. JA1026]|uniref:GlsB/YeaQ/YmgE family stress response membrane protein n=1 Tax=Rubrivivax sp. JA1026 TaxID=2710888 RepID=UPI0013E97CD0|nr:GlsB/YeaQ/YmgE family stress response membrane protein [Rubrivivax sp. JA1026]